MDEMTDVGLTPSMSLGLRIAAHFFFGIGLSELIGAGILTKSQKEQFTMEMSAILLVKSTAWRSIYY